MDDVAEANGGVFERLVEVRDAGRAPERVASRDQFHSLVRRPRRRDGARRGYAYVRVRLEVFANPHGKVRGKRRGEKRILGTDGKLAKRRLVGSSRRESGTPRIFLVGSPTPRVVLHHDPLSLVHVPAAHEHTRETRRERLVERHLERVRSRGFRHDGGAASLKPSKPTTSEKTTRSPGKGRARRRRTPSPRVRRRRG